MIELTPAYGRDYKSAKDAKTAFLAGKDFLGGFEQGFKPCGVNDFPAGTTVMLRYKRNTGVTPCKVPAKVAA